MKLHKLNLLVKLDEVPLDSPGQFWVTLKIEGTKDKVRDFLRDFSV